MLTAAIKVKSSGFTQPTGLLGLYYESESEPYEQLSAETIADEFSQDVWYWYGIDIDTVAIGSFAGLRHPHHQQGAVVVWQLNE